MNRRLSTAVLVSLLALAGCSSGDAGPGDASPGDSSPDDASASLTGDAAFCAALEDWNDVLHDAGGRLEEFGEALSEGADTGDWPTTDETHTLGAVILSMVAEADALLPVIQSNASDPDVADTFGELHVILTDLHTWAGESASGAASTDAFAALIANEFDNRFNAMNDAIDALDTDAANDYLENTCPTLVDVIGDGSGTA